MIAMTSARVSGRHKKLAILDMEYLGLSCKFGLLGCLHRGVTVQRKRYNKLSRCSAALWER
jgi:hypothetical protein